MRVETASQWVEPMINNCIEVFPKRSTQRGISMPVVLGVIAILILIVVGAYFLIFRPHHEAASAPKAQSTAAVQAASATSAPAPADVASMSAAQLLDEARNAVKAQRWVAPAGNNAFEFYLQVLTKDPNNQVALNALRESFTTGANAAEQAINANNFDEAEREISLLAKADSSNYTLTILRSKLDAQRKLSARAEQQQEQRETAEAARKAAAEAQAKQAEQESAAPSPTPERAEGAQTATPAATPKPAPKRAPVAPSPPKPVGPTHGAKLISSVPAIAPRIAVQRKRSGYAVVEFTVTTAGRVANAHVVDAQPSRIFDRAAIDAIKQWRFEPAVKDGVPHSTLVQQRINFDL